MRDVMDELHVKKHLRHFKRYELNLFLKGIGLSLEEIFKVWRSAVFPTARWQTIKTNTRIN